MIADRIKACENPVLVMPFNDGHYNLLAIREIYDQRMAASRWASDLWRDIILYDRRHR